MPTACKHERSPLEWPERRKRKREGREEKSERMEGATGRVD